MSPNYFPCIVPPNLAGNTDGDSRSSSLQRFARCSRLLHSVPVTKLFLEKDGFGATMAGILALGRMKIFVY